MSRTLMGPALSLALAVLPALTALARLGRPESRLPRRRARLRRRVDSVQTRRRSRGPSWLVDPEEFGDPV